MTIAEHVSFPSELTDFIASAFLACGVPAEDACIIATAMIDADLAGADTHGVIRLTQYVAALQSGKVKLEPQVTVKNCATSVALVDGDGGMGHLAMRQAVAVATKVARQHGLAWVGVRRSGHAGAIGVYAEQMASAGLVGICGAVSGINQLAPWGGAEPMLGTNPIAIAVPAREEPPVVLDIATSIASYGTILKYALEGRAVPPGWLIRRGTGEPVTDPAQLGEALLVPLGEHKGSGLSMMIGLLAGVASAADFGSDITRHVSKGEPVNTGQFVLALDPTLMNDAFGTDIDRHIRALESIEPVPGGDAVRVPGRRRDQVRRERTANGIPVGAALRTKLDELASRLGLTPLTVRSSA